MSDFEKVIQQLKKFSKERDWEQFHNSKDLALAISIEASELLELFLWKGNEEFDLSNLKDELADVLSFCILLSIKHDIDILEIISDKIAKNELKYPISKSKGISTKYKNL